MAAASVSNAGDWDGNGNSSVGVFRNGAFYLTNGTSGSPTVNFSFMFGAPGDRAVAGDWNGEAIHSVGVVRGGNWYLTDSRSSNPPVHYAFAFGAAGDIPVVGTWGTLAAAAVASGSASPPAPVNVSTASGVRKPVPQEMVAPPVLACAATFSCQAPPDAWYGAKSLAGPPLKSR